jgi:hypothetical protein
MRPPIYDLGLCGPLRSDLADRGEYCGMFKSPSLRNVALRRTFFHNGVFRTLRQVLEIVMLRMETWLPAETFARLRDAEAWRRGEVRLRYRVLERFREEQRQAMGGATPHVVTERRAPHFGHVMIRTLPAGAFVIVGFGSGDRGHVDRSVLCDHGFSRGLGASGGLRRHLKIKPC